ncbi:Sulfur oxidation protein SoxY [hydrothermal vent metagenome]|uniref:Sulfur oxidation protein SoxY n=1 Tax=hydrothermal vent metagenome TaxID=652676 RepID=A0A1W1D3G5_9ZZZZ
MNRRNFLSVTFGALALAVVPTSVRAEDFRKLKPLVWSAKTVDDAIKNMYGSNDLIFKGVKLKTPKVAANGGAIPVSFSTKIPAKTVSLYQDSNPESAVIVYDVGEYDLTDYGIKLKMAKSGTITVVVEGKDGKLYAAKRSLEVALGGCEG